MSRRENVPTHTVNKSPRQLKGNENAFLLFSLRLSYCVGGGGGRILPEPIVADWPISNRWKYDDALALFRLGWWCSWWLATHRKSKKKKTTQRLAQPLVLFFIFFSLKKKENKFLFIYFLFGWWLLAARPRSGQGSFLFFFLLFFLPRSPEGERELCISREREKESKKKILVCCPSPPPPSFFLAAAARKKLKTFFEFLFRIKKKSGGEFLFACSLMLRCAMRLPDFSSGHGGH